MSPVNVDTAGYLRLNGSLKVKSSLKCSKSLTLLNSNPCGTFKGTRGTGNMTKISLETEQMRFTVPQDNSTLSFKGFTTEYSKHLETVRSKMATIKKALTLKQKTAVRKALRKNCGVIPIKSKSVKAFLCSTNLCPKRLKTEKTVKAQSFSTIPQPIRIFRNDLNPKKMTMMQCKLCCRKAYFPIAQQNIPKENSFICSVSTI